MTRAWTKTARYSIPLLAFALGAACGKKADDDAAADAGDAGAAPVVATDGGSAGGVASYPNQVPQSGTKLTKVPFTIHQAADGNSPIVARIGPNTLINLKASFSSWMLIEYPSGVGQLSPGWINLDIKDRVKVDDAPPPDAGAKDAAAEAAAPDAGADAAKGDGGRVPVVKIRPKK